MALSQVSFRQVSTRDVADWLDRQGDYVYWSVDGDPLLASRLSFPRPGDELASELREIDKSLFVIDPRGGSQAATPSLDLDDFVEKEELGTRVLQFRWTDSETPWLLIEDEETSESAEREMSSN